MGSPFKQKYIINDKILEKSDKKIQRVKLKNDQVQNLYISVHIKEINLSQAELNNLISCRFLNLMPYFDKIEHNEERIIIYKDYFKYIVEPNQLQDQQTAKRILLQLFLTYAELEQRKYYWPLNSIEQLYYYNGMMFLSLIEYDFINCQQTETHLETLKRFSRKYFLQMIPNLDDIFKENSFEPIIKFLLQINGNLDKKDYLRGPYESLLQNLFYVQNFEKIYDANQSIVKCFKKPLNFIQAEECDEQIVYKTSRSEKFEDIVALQINRQIEFLEKFYKCSHMAAGFAYFRVLKQPFFFMRKYEGTLQNKFNEQATCELINYKSALQLSQRFAYSLMELQKMKILHRDLKPENLYLDNKDLKYSTIYIADFDRSKVLQEQYHNEMTMQHQSNTFRYDPPETIQSLKYDIFQFGLIILQLANKGKYIGNENAGCRFLNEIELNSYYSEQSIAIQLKHTQYPEKFIELIARCLKMNPEDRPSINEVYEILKDLYQKVIIQVKKQG